MRKCGVLLPVASLPSDYGIGCFSKESYEFVDFLEKAGQSYWQILPLGPTGYGDSPYQSFSTFAGNPYFIDPESFITEGLLSEKECQKVDFGKNPRAVDYEKIYNGRFRLLRKAFERSNIQNDEDFRIFVKENDDWLSDYALYMAVKEFFGGKSYMEWPKDIRSRNKKAMAEYRTKLEQDILFHEFLQYHFLKQWSALKAYANKKGIQIVGDIPIYVAFDSADTWSGAELFQLNEEGYPIGVAGCPPDVFSATGQLWGNPLYDWKYHKETDFAWWTRRMEHCLKLYDVIRIDHFRGFDEYYFIPYGDPTAENGHWEPGPGYALFEALKRKLGKMNIIAEDLGFLTPSVLKLVKKTGYPGMKVLQFAFGGDCENAYLPHNHVKNSIVYTGTHDNDTCIGWYESENRNTKKYVREYLGLKNGKDIHLAMVRAALASVCDTAVIPMQDYLGLGHETRINMPSTLGGGNWCFRILPGELSEDLAKKMKKLAELYNR